MLAAFDQGKIALFLEAVVMMTTTMTIFAALVRDPRSAVAVGKILRETCWTRWTTMVALENHILEEGILGQSPWTISNAPLQYYEIIKMGASVIDLHQEELRLDMLVPIENMNQVALHPDMGNLAVGLNLRAIHLVMLDHLQEEV